MTDGSGTSTSTRTGTEDPPALGRADAHARRLRTVLLGSLAALTAAVLWWSLVPHPGSTLGPTASYGICVGREDPTERDVAFGIGVVLAPAHDVEVTDVRLVAPVNVAVGGAFVVPPALPPGGMVVPGVSTGWPLSDEQRAELSLDWAAERDLVGAHLQRGAEEVPLLHLVVQDPTQDASFSAVQVEYRRWGAPWVATYDVRFRLPGGPGVTARC